MKRNNVQIAFVLLTSCLILIGYGHGVAPIIFLSLFLLITPWSHPIEINLKYVFENFALNGTYEEVIPAVSFILLVGVLLLVVALFLKKHIKKLVTIVGIVIIISGYLILVLPFDETQKIFSGVTGIPFLLISIKRLIQLMVTRGIPQDMKKAS